MAKSRKIADLLEWFHREKPVLENLARTAESILQNLLKKHQIPTVSISSRVKGSDSLIGKQRRKRYKNPISQITDFIGLRVITYTEDDATRVCEIVKAAFTIDAALSADKGQELETDQVGYRSHHFICHLGEKRVALPEFEAFNGKVFELQIRTVLQHAWAEVEHDKNYKFAGVLPAILARRLYLISGLLEVGDRELNQLSRDIDAYVASVAKRATQGQLDDELNSTTLAALLPEVLKSLSKTEIEGGISPSSLNLLVDECLSLGVKTTAQFKALFTRDFLDVSDQPGIKNTQVGFVRDALMFADLERYFSTAWKERWNSTDPETVERLGKRYSKAKVLLVLAQHSVDVFDEDDERFAYSDDP